MEKKLWFVFCKSDILLRKTSEGGYEIPYSEQPPTELKPWTTVHNITPMGDIPVQTYRIEAPITDDADYEMCGDYLLGHQHSVLRRMRRSDEETY